MAGGVAQQLLAAKCAVQDTRFGAIARCKNFEESLRRRRSLPEYFYRGVRSNLYRQFFGKSANPCRGWGSPCINFCQEFSSIFRGVRMRQTVLGLGSKSSQCALAWTRRNNSAAYLTYEIWRGWRGSNPRPSASEADTLSTELQPRVGQTQVAFAVCCPKPLL